MLKRCCCEIEGYKDKTTNAGINLHLLFYESDYSASTRSW